MTGAAVRPQLFSSLQSLRVSEKTPSRPLVNSGKRSQFIGAPWRGSGDATAAKPSKRGPVGGKAERKERQRPTRFRRTGLGFGSRRG
jgi:hypothetical protein